MGELEDRTERPVWAHYIVQNYFNLGHLRHDLTELTGVEGDVGMMSNVCGLQRNTPESMWVLP